MNKKYLIKYSYSVKDKDSPYFSVYESAEIIDEGKGIDIQVEKLKKKYKGFKLIDIKPL